MIKRGIGRGSEMGINGEWIARGNDWRYRKQRGKSDESEQGEAAENAPQVRFSGQIWSWNTPSLPKFNRIGTTIIVSHRFVLSPESIPRVLEACPGSESENCKRADKSYPAASEDQPEAGR